MCRTTPRACWPPRRVITPERSTRSAHCRPDPRRARPRAARGRRPPCAAGVRAGRRRHGQDPGHHPPHRLRRAHRASSSPQRCSRSPSPPAPPARCAAGCAGSARRASRPAPSTPPRCASSSTSGRRRSAARLPAAHRRASCSSSPTRRAACRIRLDRASCATSPPRSSGPRSPRLTPADYAARGRQGAAASQPASTRGRWPGSSQPTRTSSASAASSTSRTSCC